MKKALQRALVLAGFSLASPFSQAVDPSCQAIAAQAEKQGSALMPRLSYAVGGQGRLYFYAAPAATCRLASFVVPKDELIGYTELNGWLSVMYINPKTGEDTSGWVQAGRLHIRGTMGPG